MLSSTSVYGRTTQFVYDINGNQVASWSFGGVGAYQVQVLNKTAFDELNRSVGSVQAVLPAGEFITTNLATAIIPAQYVISQTSTVYNAAGQVTLTTDRNGLQTQNTYDIRGQLIQTRRESVDENGDPVWLISRTAYDAAGRTIASTSQYLEGTTDPVFGSLNTYDAAGRVTLSEQVIGLVISITGTANNEEAVVMDDGTFISSSSTTYATSGQVTSSVDSYGRTSQTVYNEFGDVTESRREAFDENGSSVWFVSRTVYDSYGRTVVSTEQYPEGTSEPIQGTQTVYDQQGRTIQSIRRSGIVVAIDSATGNSTLTINGTTVSQNQTTYNADGRVAVTTDSYDRETHTTYDSLGRTTQTRRQSVDENGNIVWLVSRTVYDNLGRVDVSTDQYLEGSTGPIYGTRSVYDALGRAVNTVRLEGIAVSINAVTGNSTLTFGGTPLWQTETLYNSDGTVFQQIAADGQITEYEYDALRRQIAEIGTPVVINGQTVRRRSETVYDSQGRTLQQRTNITQFANGTIDATDVQTTTHEYDSRGNIVKTTFTDNTFVAMAYDDRGRKISETNQMGLTRTFAYDSQGRLASVSLPDLDGNSATTNDIAKYEYAYDARGNMVQLTDPLGRDTRWTFNDRGQQLTRTLPLGFGIDGMFGTADDLPPLPPGEGWGEGRFTENMSYDVKGRMTQQTSFEGVVTEYVYDDAVNGSGRLRETRFYANQDDYDNALISESQTMTYDAFGREVSIVWDRTVSNPGTRIDTWTKQYDVQGRLTRVESPAGDINYEYDVFGCQTRVVTGTTGSYAGDIADPVTDIRYSYDSLSRLSKVEAFEKNNVPVDVDPVTAGNQPETESYAYTLNGSLDYEVNPDGSTTDYTYDELNRLTDIDEFRASTTTPDVFTDNPKLSEYNYTLRADGKRNSADEIIYSTDGTTPVSHTQFDWTYDAASRLTDEVFTDVGNLLTDVDNYHTSFEYDLTGNRLTQTTITDTSGDGLFDVATDDDEVTTYESDANNRLKTEHRTLNTQAVDTTDYGYTSTQQSSKTVTPASALIASSVVNFSYDLQGRMSAVISTIQNPATGTATRNDTIGYRYGTDGIRISARQEMDTNADGTIDSVENTEYLVDANNHTGYQQVLEETVTDANGDLIRKIVYTIGLDHISQTTFTPGGPAQGTTAVFHMDGHGSTRILTDLAGTIAQIYHYTAYGNAINFQMANAATQYLYSGEQFDARIGQQYLRARYYNQANGTFNRLDPFFGNLSDPQSFHKYLYTHGDPANGTDPTGRFGLGLALGLGGLLAGVAFGHGVQSRYNAAVTANGGAAIGGLLGKLGLFGKLGFGLAGTLTGVWAPWLAAGSPGFQELWEHPSVSRPTIEDNIKITDWVTNVENILKNHVENRSDINQQQKAAGIQAAHNIAEAYVKATHERAIQVFKIENASDIMFGNKGGDSGWWGNREDSARDCDNWASCIRHEVPSEGGWKVIRVEDSLKAGDILLGIAAKHNFVLLEFDPNNTNALEPAFVLDPWPRARPDIYEFEEYNKYWPIEGRRTY